MFKMMTSKWGLYFPFCVNSQDGVGLLGISVFQHLTPDILMRTSETGAKKSAFSKAPNVSLVF